MALCVETTQLTSSDGRLFFRIKCEGKCSYEHQIHTHPNSNKSSILCPPLFTYYRMRRYNKRKKSQHQKKFIFYHRSNALSLFTQKERMKKKTHEMRVIDTHPIKIKYQNYTHTGFCCCGIWLPWVFLLSMMTEKIARFFVTREKPFCNLISGNKLKNQIQTNFIDRKKTTTRKSGRYPFFHEFFFSVVNQKDISHKVNQKKKKNTKSVGLI